MHCFERTTVLELTTNACFRILQRYAAYLKTNFGVSGSRAAGFSHVENEDVSINTIRKYFRPEFFNRIDDVLAFQVLTDEAVLAITRIELNGIRQRDRIKEANIQLEFSEALVEFIANAGFSSVYGARPIQRAVEKHVVRAISKQLLSDGDVSKLSVDVRDESVTVDV